MHSSRVRTARLLTVSEGVCIGGEICIGEGSASRGEGVCIQGEGVCIQGEGVCVQGEGVCIQGGWADPPEQNDRQV